MSKINARSGTFTDNMKLPIHRWFRYSAGFSAEWVENEIKIFQEETGQNAVVLDPFVGSGTTLLAASAVGAKSYGLESHPFIYRVAKAKLQWNVNLNKFKDAIEQTINLAKKIESPSERYIEGTLLYKCYTPGALSKLEALKHAYIELKTRSPVWELVWLNITTILRISSGAGTAQWQYVLPKKSKAKTTDPYEAFTKKAEIMATDMEFAQLNNWLKNSHLINQDSRILKIEDKANLLITSPPYPNNYDYADATRLEMTFWGEIEGWKDLQSVVRKHLIRACSQHSAAERVVLEDILSKPELKPILKPLTKVCNELAEVRKTKGGKKTYHTMIAAYFYDNARIFINLRELMTANSKLCYVIGDSAPYGVHVPAEKWLGKLAIAAGFKSFKFEKLRDRNIKWKNRTHTVPLHEGRLWIRG